MNHCFMHNLERKSYIPMWIDIGLLFLFNRCMDMTRVVFYIIHPMEKDPILKTVKLIDYCMGASEIDRLLYGCQ